MTTATTPNARTAPGTAAVPTQPVDTTAAPRRVLRLRSLAQLRAELDRLDRRAEQFGRPDDGSPLPTTGNWTAAQNIWHVARFIEGSMDGFPQPMPWPIRAIARLLFKRQAVGPKPFPPGFRLPKQAAFMVPPDGVAWAEASAKLRGLLDRLDAGERLSRPSPLLGRMTHDDWVGVHLKHASLHLAFIAVPWEDDTADPSAGAEAPGGFD